MNKFLTTLVFVLFTLAIGYVLIDLFGGHVFPAMDSQHGGSFQNSRSFMLVPLLIIGAPIALWWAIKVISKKK